MTNQQPHPERNSSDAQHDAGGHAWMMIACCIPMLVIAVALVAAGVVGPGFILVALVCAAMMALMMRGMHGPSRPDQRQNHDQIGGTGRPR